MSADFTKCIKQVFDNEGGYSNDHNDSGGETMYGITKAVARENGYTGEMKNLPKATASEIFYKKYWLAGKLDKVKSTKIAFLVLDTNVNHGLKNATIILQRALNRCDAGLKVDGIFGAKTLQAVNDNCKKDAEADLINALIAERLKFYIGISKWYAYSKGWTRRVANNLIFLKELKNA